MSKENTTDEAKAEVKNMSNQQIEYKKMGYDNLFATRLRKLLEDTNISQIKLATDTQITPQSISYYAEGSRTPNIEILVKIAQYFNVSTDYLLGLTDNKTTSAELQAVCKYTGLSESSVNMIHEFTDTYLFNQEVLNVYDSLLGSEHIRSAALSLIDIQDSAKKITDTALYEYYINKLNNVIDQEAPINAFNPCDIVYGSIFRANEHMRKLIYEIIQNCVEDMEHRNSMQCMKAIADWKNDTKTIAKALPENVQDFVNEFSEALEGVSENIAKNIFPNLKEE